MLLEDALAENGLSHLVATELAVRGDLDFDAVERALDGLTRRHEALRTRYWFDGVDFSSEIVADARAQLCRVRARTAADLAHIRKAALERRIDLATPTVPALTVVDDGKESYRLLFAFHHVACDGWSLAILIREFAELYNAAVENRPAALDEPVQMTTDIPPIASEDALTFWRRHLAGGPDVLALPLDKPRPHRQSQDLARLACKIEAHLISGARELARARRASLFAALLSPFIVLMACYAETDDVCVAVPVSGRLAPDVLDTVGCFVNTVVIRTVVDPTAQFGAVVDDVQARLLEAQVSRRAPFVDVVRAVGPRRTPAYHPITQVMFAMQPEMPRVALAGARSTHVVLDTEVPERTGFDIVANFAPTDNHFAGWIDYDIALFDRATIRTLVADYNHVLRHATEHPTDPIQRATAETAARRLRRAARE